MMWKKGRVQKRTTKTLSLDFLFKIEWHLIEVNCKCFFPGRKYRTIKVFPREKAWGNQGLKSAPSCQVKMPVSPKSLGLPAAISSRCPSPSQLFPGTIFAELLFLRSTADIMPILPRAAGKTQGSFPMLAAQNLLFLAELPLFC